MYEQYYHLNADPFCLNPDPRFNVLHSSYRKAKTYILFALNRGEGFLLVTGKPGTGKSTLIQEVLNEIKQSRFQITTLAATQIKTDDLLRKLAASYKLPVDKTNKATVIQYVRRYLIDRRQQRKHTVLVVDEAQELSETALEELRLLANLKLNNRPLLQIFLAGQPQLYDVLSSGSMDQLRQHITVTATLRPLSADEVEAYIQRRLTVAGWRHDPEFDKNIYPLIHEESEGIPKRINQICNRLLLHSYVEAKHTVNTSDFNTVMKEIAEEHPHDTYETLSPQNPTQENYTSVTTGLHKKELH
ncbi:MAG: AAA family ATPase [Gammaproteobacteria bacterium]|jgi:type II secretory pathway predicted ATPase ExeA